ncbi:hypothetical protein [Methanosphaera sp. WGK6]|uniref:hypothetical protein n=1 Tax=Methanosphaera sp. WGK6 TaxID=1561964 RepID=UPI00084C190D|nr:hypothetical protein [Methanosphaera sp. WGK6]OED30530.1 hypothetical protein NL43_02625 [Methanosphaera sp. WGK6]
MAARIIEGYKLYKKDAVIVEHYEPDHVIFKVKKNENDFYLVSMIYGYWNCDCADYIYRNQRQPGSFYCKHLQAAQFKLLDLLKEKDKK